MKVKVKGPINIELTNIEFDTKEMFEGLKESVKGLSLGFPILGVLQPGRGPRQTIPKVAMNLSKEELLAFATQMKIPHLENIIKELQEVLKRRRDPVEGAS